MDNNELNRKLQELSDLAAKWGLGTVHNELDELLKKFPEQNRPATALELGMALASFLDDFAMSDQDQDTYRSRPDRR